MLANKTFLFVDQSSPDFFHGTREESLSITFLSDFGYLESFQRYSRSKSKVVKNRAEFRTFFALPNFRGPLSKSYTHVMTPAWRHVERKMFCEDTPTSPEVIVANTLNFKANFKFSGFNFFFGRGGPVPLRVCAIKAWAISSACINFRAQHPLGAEI